MGVYGEPQYTYEMPKVVNTYENQGAQMERRLVEVRRESPDRGREIELVEKPDWNRESQTHFQRQYPESVNNRFEFAGTTYGGSNVRNVEYGQPVVTRNVIGTGNVVRTNYGTDVATTRTLNSNYNTHNPFDR